MVRLPFVVYIFGSNLYVAGCCLSNTNERKAAAKLLEDIEDELGWAAKYRVRDLHEQWGSLQGG